MIHMAQRSNFYYFKSPDTLTWSVRIWCSSRHPEVQGNISETKSSTLFHLENFLCPVKFMTTGSFQFCHLLQNATVRMNITESSLLNLESESLEKHSYIRTTHNKEITLKAGAAQHSLRSNSSQYGAVTCISTQVQVLKFEKINWFGWVSRGWYQSQFARLKMSLQISKQTFSKNINEHFI